MQAGPYLTGTGLSRRRTSWLTKGTTLTTGLTAKISDIEGPKMGKGKENNRDIMETQQ